MIHQLNGFRAIGVSQARMSVSGILGGCGSVFDRPADRRSTVPPKDYAARNLWKDILALEPEMLHQTVVIFAQEGGMLD